MYDLDMGRDAAGWSTTGFKENTNWIKLWTKASLPDALVRQLLKDKIHKRKAPGDFVQGTPKCSEANLWQMAKAGTPPDPLVIIYPFR